MKLTLGQYLRQIREERGLTLDQIAQATRINLHYLRALENDEPSLLPSAVQAKGYLRLIAGELKIDPQPLLAAFPDKEIILELLPATEEEQQPEGMKQADSPSSEIPQSSTALAEESTPEPPADEPPPVPQEEEEIPPSPPEEGSSAFIFTQLGEQLRAQREALGISLEDAERFTRLKSRYLKAIEEGRLDQLPSLVQGRGMLRNYAEFLNLDGEAVLLQFAEGLQRRRLEHLAATAPPRSTTPTSRVRLPDRFSLFIRRWLTPDLVVGGLLFSILVVFVIWGTARVSGLQNQQTSETPPSISEILIGSPDASGLAESTSITTPTSSQNAGVPLPPSAGGGEETQPAAELPVSSGPVQVYVIANQRVWMRVVVDNRVAFEGRTIPGSAYPFSGQNTIELTSANAAGIQIIYNQDNLGSLGASGEVLRLIFTAQGTLVPTPLFTSTPAPTQPPTFTPQPTPLLPTPTVTPFVP